MPTEWSLLVDVQRWSNDADSERRRLGEAWQAILRRQIRWKMACERLIRFDPGQPEPASIFTDAGLVESRIRGELPASLRAMRFALTLESTRTSFAIRAILYKALTRPAMVLHVFLVRLG